MSNHTDPVRVALVGCGDISSSHLKAYEALGMKVVALCDVIVPRAERRRDEFKLEGAQIFDDHRDMLAKVDCDIVTVATPVACHAPVTVNALRAGRHVACEKPSTLCIAENRQIIEEARKADRRVMFFSSRMRWAEAILARQYIASGEVGEIYRVNVQFYRRRGRPGVDIIPNARWFVDKKLAGGGIVMDMGQYFMDMVLDLTGWPEIQTASATTFRGFPHDLPSDIPFDVEEHCTILARSKQISYTFDLAWISNHPETRNITILGTKGGIRITSDGFHFHSERGAFRFLDTTSTWKDKTPMNDHVYQSLISAIRGEAGRDGVSCGTTPQQALAITRLTQASLQSAELGREMRIDELAEGVVDLSACEATVRRQKELWASGAISLGR